MKKVAGAINFAKIALKARSCSQVNSEAGRYYTFQDRKMTSVTNYVSNFFPFSPRRAIDMMKKANTFETKYPGKTDEEVIREWNLNGLRAAREGTEMHKVIEDYLSKFYLPEEKRNIDDRGYYHELKLARKFVKDKELYYVDGEISIFDEDLALAGTFDAIFIDSNLNFYLVDWKRSLNVEKNLDKYKLQTLTYANILYNKYNIKISKCIVIGLHSSFNDYQCFEFDTFIKFNTDQGEIELPANKTITDLIFALDCRVPYGEKNLNKFLFKMNRQNFVRTRKISRELLENDDLLWKSILNSSRLLRKTIVYFNINPNLRDANGETILHVLVKNKAKDSIRVLLDLGANIHMRCPKGSTPYKLCLLIENKDIFDIFVEYEKINLDGIYQNETSLTYAIKNSLKEMFSHVLAKGANPTKKNSRGETPLKVSMKKTDRVFSRRLIKYIGLHKRK